MKKKSISDRTKEHGWEVSTHKIDTKFRLELLKFLRQSSDAKSADVLAAHFKRPAKEVEYYLDMLMNGNLAQYIHVGRREWGWVAARIEKN